MCWGGNFGGGGVGIGGRRGGRGEVRLRPVGARVGRVLDLLDRFV